MSHARRAAAAFAATFLVTVALGWAATGPAVGRRAEVAAVLAAHYYRDLDARQLAAATAAPMLHTLPTVLGDPYTVYLSPADYARWTSGDAGRYVGVGLTARADAAGVVVTGVSPGGPAERGGLRPGDRVVAVDGAPVAGLGAGAVLDRIRGAPGSAVTVGWTRGGAATSATLAREEVTAALVTTALRRVDGRAVGLIRLVEFDDGVGEAVRSGAAALAAAGAEVLVLDLRGDGGGLVAEACTVASAFLPRGAAVFGERGAHVVPRTYRTDESPTAAALPLLVLVDHDTASAAEIVTGALRDAHRARVAGGTTFGKGVIQDVAPLRDGGAVKFTVAEYRTPAGAVIDHRGLVPDVALPAVDPLGPGADAEADAAVRTVLPPR